MKETDLQDKYVMKFLCEEPNGLRYREVKANTVSPQFFVVEDLRRFLAETSLNEKSYKQLLSTRFGGDEKALLAALTEFLNLRIGESANMALFFHHNTTVTFEGVRLHLFYPSGGVTDAQDKLFEENIFSVVQELPYAYKHGGSTRFQFRPDLTFFLNGMYLGYCELKSNYNNQTAHRNGRRKVAKDYLQAAQAYLKLAEGNDVNQSIRRDFLKIFEKAIHVTSTDLTNTYVIRSLAPQLDELKAAPAGEIDGTRFQESLEKDFPAYPLRRPEGTIRQRFEEVFRALYDKRMMEKEILYYNFLEREFIKKEGSPQKEYKHNDGRLISPRPKQKFGTDKVIDKIDELLAHEAEPDYFINQLRQQLKKLGVGDAPAQELIAQRLKYHNNKYVYSLLLQYAAGFGKSNIIGWLALQLKDLRRNSSYVYDKILIVVDRLQLRDQLDTKMHNMNIQKSMFVEADTKAIFLEALQNDSPRIVVVNLQKFGQVAETLPPEVLAKLSGLRVAFLIDEIHRSNSGGMGAAMLDVFEELQKALDDDVKAQPLPPAKKNLLVGFTATPSSRTLARFGEFAHYAENQALWVPFDSFTMREAIAAGFILNPLLGVVPVSAKMYFEVPENALAGFEGDTGYDVPDNTDTGIDAEGRKYAIRKRRIYQNPERIQAIAQFVVERLVASVYPNIRGTAKAMLAVASIQAAIQYKKVISQTYAAITQQKKYERFKDAPVYIVYSDSQEHPAASTLNDGQTEAQVMQNFAVRKNGLIIVVDKLQTGFDEPKLHTLFLDKEIRDINAIQTISRVNRKIKYKNDCKIIDFSYQNVNVKNIKEAFEKFSNVVVSDFDPLGSEQQLAVHYDDLRAHALFKAHFSAYAHYHQSGQTDITPILELEEAFATYINTQPDEAKKLKKKIGKYFRILNLIAFVLDIDTKFNEEHFLRFWRRYNHEYNSIHGNTDPVDEVEIYFDHQIGIVVPAELPAKATGQLSIVSEDAAPFGKKYKYNILRVIEKRNQQEEAIEALIKDFEAKIDLLFDFIRTDHDGKRIVAKMQSTNAHFDAEEIYGDFLKVYRKFTRRRKEEVGEFFIRETKGNINQLCDDFENDILSAQA